MSHTVSVINPPADWKKLPITLSKPNTYKVCLEVLDSDLKIYYITESQAVLYSDPPNNETKWDKTKVNNKDNYSNYQWHVANFLENYEHKTE
jgi:hypothetical protein